jgi:hypothetical protein
MSCGLRRRPETLAGYFTSTTFRRSSSNRASSSSGCQPDVNLFDFKGITHGSEVVDGGDLAFDREEIPLQPAGLRRLRVTSLPLRSDAAHPTGRPLPPAASRQAAGEDARLDELRLNVVEVK